MKKMILTCLHLIMVSVTISVKGDIEPQSLPAQVFPNDPFFASDIFVLIPYFALSRGVYTYGTYYTIAEQYGLYNRGTSSVLYNASSVQYSGYTEPGDGGTRADISAPEGWAIRHDAPNTIVAVIDTGIDYRHPDLIDNLWTNSSAVYYSTNVSDTNGICFNENSGTMVVSSDIMDNAGHGTHVAGLIGAVGNNGFGVSGVAWKVQILPIATHFGVNEVIAGIEYAVNHGAKIINFSYGYSTETLALKSAIQWAGEHGVIFVASAEDASVNYDTTPDYPLSWKLPNVIMVTYTDKNGNLDPVAGYGVNTVHIAAPGRRVVSTHWLNNTDTLVHSGAGTFITNQFGYFTGTSEAAPIVSGVLALVREQYPDESVPQLVQRLMISARRNTNLVGKVISGGMVNLYNALTWFPPRINISTTDQTVNIETSPIGNYWLESSTNMMDWSSVSITNTSFTLPINTALPEGYFRIRMESK